MKGEILRRDHYSRTATLTGERSQDRAKLSFFSQDEFVLFYRTSPLFVKEKGLQIRN
jgi:hypothetical protein